VPFFPIKHRLKEIFEQLFDVGLALADCVQGITRHPPVQITLARRIHWIGDGREYDP